MFFMMGINEGRKELNYHQMIVCNHCGAYGQYQVFMHIWCCLCFSYLALSGTGSILF